MFLSGKFLSYTSFQTITVYSVTSIFFCRLHESKRTEVNYLLIFLVKHLLIKLVTKIAIKNNMRGVRSS